MFDLHPLRPWSPADTSRSGPRRGLRRAAGHQRRDGHDRRSLRDAVIARADRVGGCCPRGRRPARDPCSAAHRQTAQPLVDPRIDRRRLRSRRRVLPPRRSRSRPAWTIGACRLHRPAVSGEAAARALGSTLGGGARQYRQSVFYPTAKQLG